MFSKKIIDSDAFLDMPLSTQALYFHLSMRADDDGFINNPKKISRMLGVNDDDLKLLIAKKFIIPFDNGIVVIKHWKIHNYIQKDRYTETSYKDEKSMLFVDSNKAYTTSESSSIIHLDTECIQNVYNVSPQVRLGKDRLGKVSIDKDSKESKGRNKFTPPTLEEITQYCLDRNNNVDPVKFYDYFTVDPDRQWIDSKGNKVKNWKQKIISWEGRSNATARGFSSQAAGTHSTASNGGTKVKYGHVAGTDFTE